jgi:hypothetical protein
VLLESPVIVLDRAVSPLWFETVVAKLDLVDTWSAYDEAVADEFQESIGATGWSTALLVGEESTGTAGCADTARGSKAIRTRPTILLLVVDMIPPLWMINDLRNNKEAKSVIHLKKSLDSGGTRCEQFVDDNPGAESES